MHYKLLHVCILICCCCCCYSPLSLHYAAVAAVSTRSFIFNNSIIIIIITYTDIHNMNLNSTGERMLHTIHYFLCVCIGTIVSPRLLHRVNLCLVCIVLIRFKESGLYYVLNTHLYCVLYANVFSLILSLPPPPLPLSPLRHLTALFFSMCYCCYLLLLLFLRFSSFIIIINAIKCSLKSLPSLLLTRSFSCLFFCSLYVFFFYFAKRTQKLYMTTFEQQIRN